jgi:hypothetical protein
VFYSLAEAAWTLMGLCKVNKHMPREHFIQILTNLHGYDMRHKVLYQGTVPPWDIQDVSYRMFRTVPSFVQFRACGTSNSHVLLVRGTCPSRIGISHPGWASMYITYVASRVVRRTAYVRAVPCVPYRVLNFFQVSVPSSK